MMHHRRHTSGCRFMGMRSMSRDESMVEYMLKMLVQVLINFSMGLIMALVVSVVCFFFSLASFDLLLSGREGGGGNAAFVETIIFIFFVVSLILSDDNNGRKRDHMYLFTIIWMRCAPLRQIFIFGLWGIIRTYQPNPLTGLFFFVTASCAAFAFVSSYLMFLFGAAGGGLYGMAKLAESNMRIEGGGGGGGGQQRRDIRGGRIDRTGGGGYNRPHYQ